MLFADDCRINTSMLLLGSLPAQRLRWWSAGNSQNAARVRIPTFQKVLQTTEDVQAWFKTTFLDIPPPWT